MKTFRKERKGRHKGFGRNKQGTHFGCIHLWSESQTSDNFTVHQLASRQGFHQTNQILTLSSGSFTTLSGDCSAIRISTLQKRKVKVKNSTDLPQATCQREGEPGFQDVSPPPGPWIFISHLQSLSQNPATPRFPSQGITILDKWTPCLSPLKEG